MPALRQARLFSAMSHPCFAAGISRHKAPLDMRHEMKKSKIPDNAQNAPQAKSSGDPILRVTNVLSTPTVRQRGRSYR
jgi:hypothetical protein